MAASTRYRITVGPVAFVRQVFRRLLGPDRRGLSQSLLALSILAIATVGAGLVLGHGTERLDELPGLLLLVPAAIALRGNIFGALGSRLGTSIHTGNYRLSLRFESVVGANVWASVVLTFVVSAVVAVGAKAAAVIFGLPDTMTIRQFLVISVLGGLMASVVVLLVALALTSGSVRYGWDPDNVTAPLVTAAGDLATLPALLIAGTLVTHSTIVDVTSVGVVAITLVALSMTIFRAPRLLRLIVMESIPVLIVAGLLDLVAGVTVEKQLVDLQLFPALLVLLPGYLAAAGALGGILSSRLSSKLHLGLLVPTARPSNAAWSDVGATFALAVPVFGLVAIASHYGSSWSGLASPGVGDMVSAVLIGGVIATAIVVMVAYYGTIAAVHFGADPDTYGIPLVTSVLDLVGAFTFVLAINWVVF